MNHKMKLQPRYYDFILNGTKRIELRLYDEKRQKINIGDTIIFQKEPELEITMKVKVIGLLRYDTFEELFKDFDIKILVIAFQVSVFLHFQNWNRPGPVHIWYGADLPLTAVSWYREARLPAFVSSVSSFLFWEK